MASLVPWRSRERGGLTGQRGGPLGRFHDEFDDLFDRFFGRAFGTDPMFERAGRVDLSDEGNELVVRADMPGFEPGDVDIQVHDDFLTIKVETKQEQKEGADVRQQRFRSFRETFSLPRGIDTGKVEATYRNGVLEVHLPKSPEAQARRIEVKHDGSQQSLAGQAQTQAPEAQNPARQGQAKTQPASTKK
jgi:HSP20 family protein